MLLSFSRPVPEESGVGGLVFGALARTPWILERCHGLARRALFRVVAGGRFSGEQLLAEVQWRLNSLISGAGYSAYQVVFGSNSEDFFVRGNKDEDLLSAQDASPSRQFAQQWKLRMMVQEAGLKDVANSKLWRPLAYNKSCRAKDRGYGAL